MRCRILKRLTFERQDMRIVGAAALLCAVTAACLPRSRSMAEPESVHQLILAEQVNLLDTLAREPMLVEDISGALFVGGYNRRRPGLWKSTDRGHTWARVDVGTAEQGAIGNSDLDLAIGPEGALYFVTLTYDAATGAGLQVAVGVSRDAGARWHWTTLSRVRFVDPVEPRERVRQIGIADPRCRYRTDFRIFSAFGLRSLSAISCSDIRSCQSEFPTPATDRKETERPREGWFNLYILFSRSVKQRHAVSIAAELEDGGANADVTLLEGTASKQVDERL